MMLAYQRLLGQVYAWVKVSEMSVKSTSVLQSWQSFLSFRLADGVMLERLNEKCLSSTVW
jgi:hypothetical protein